MNSRAGSPFKFIVFFWVAIFCIACSDNPPAVSPTTMDSGLSITMALDKGSYKIGEPIFATLNITNVSTDTLQIGTGGDYRSGRIDRFDIRVVDAHGEPVPDPLHYFSASMQTGGLGSGVELARGQTNTTRALLNLYTAPRNEGAYTVSGTYRLSLDLQGQHNRIINLPPVTFQLRNRVSSLSESEMRARLDEYGFDSVHECIVHGLQNNTAKIPDLLKLAQREGSPYEERHKLKLHERNALAYALQAIALMQDKLAVYHALEIAIANQKLEQTYWELMSSPVGMAFLLAKTPEWLPFLEQSMNHSNPNVQQLAFGTALSLGSLEALKKLPEALRSSEDDNWATAREYAFQYLMLASRPDGSAQTIPGLNREHAAQYEDVLLDAYREIDRRQYKDSKSNGDDWNLLFLYEFHWYSNRVWEAVDIAVQSHVPDKHIAALRFLNLRNGRFYERIEDGKIQQYLPFVHKQAEEHPDPEARELATAILKQWGME